MSTTPTDPLDQPADPPNRDSVARGVGYGFLVILATFLCGAIFFPIWWFFIAAFGIAQVVPLVPTLIYLRKRGQSKTIRGVMIVAGIGFLINATCAGIVIGGMSSQSFH